MQSFLFTFFTVASLHFLAVITPGPDFAVVTKNALAYSRREAIITSLGIASGIAVHSTYCILGLAIVIAKSLVIFNIIKYLGAAYLLYLGVKIWLPHKSPAAAVESDEKSLTPQISRWQSFKEGLFCNLLNPKATLFTLGMYTLAIKPGTPWWERTFYGVWMVVVTFLWFSFVSIIITNPHVRDKIWRIQPIALKVMGVLLIVFAINLVLYSHHVT